MRKGIYLITIFVVYKQFETQIINNLKTKVEHIQLLLIIYDVDIFRQVH